MIGNIKRRLRHSVQNNSFFKCFYTRASKVKTRALILMPDEKYLKMRFRENLGEKLDLKMPQTFNMKMQWLKLHNRNPLYTELVDKYAVRKFVEKQIGPDVLNTIYGVYDAPNEIDYNLLPEKFVLKCTHDCGSIVICEDKRTFDAERAGKKLSAAMRMNYFWVGREWPYKNVRPRIIAEKYLENGAEGLHDYKVWCFNGEPKLIQYVTGRDRGTTYDSFYNTDWQRQNISFHNPPCPYETPKPARLDDLLRMAKTLAADIPFVRCDFYILEDDSIVFGEMTFFPMGGTESWKPKEWDLKLGEMLDLSGVKTQSKSNDQDN